MAGDQRLSRSERERRDARVLELFLSGLTLREIGGATGLRSVSGVHRIVARELAAGARRREVLTDDAFALWQERSEALIHAHWERAMGGDYRSSEVCRKVLASQARMYRLGEAAQELPGPTQTLAGAADDDEPENELDRLRARRAGAAEVRS